MMPPKDWTSKTVKELKDLACELGNHNANWMNQAFEWAQRIENGESWEVLCNNIDEAKWYRMVIWKNGNAKVIGGTHYNYDKSATNVTESEFSDDDELINTVPLIVSYDE